MTSLKWIKRITGIGLSFMTPDAQEERMARVFEGDHINSPALAALIDECVTAASAFLEKSNDEEQKNMIRGLLNDTDGKQIVANMAGEEDIQWLLELKERIPLTVADVAKL